MMNNIKEPANTHRATFKDNDLLQNQIIFVS